MDLFILGPSGHNHECLCIYYRGSFPNILHPKLLKDHREPCRDRASGYCMREKWIACIPGVYPSYISPEEYEKNQTRLDENAAWGRTRSKGTSDRALLATIVRCGRCGCNMQVAYKTDRRNNVRVVSASVQ